MKNYHSLGNMLTVPAPAAVQSGDGVVVGQIFGVASNTAETGEAVAIATEGVYSFPKVAADAFSIGEPAYFDESEGLVTVTASGNVAIGVAIEAAGAGVATVNVRLDGVFA